MVENLATRLVEKMVKFIDENKGTVWYEVSDSFILVKDNYITDVDKSKYPIGIKSDELSFLGYYLFLCRG